MRKLISFFGLGCLLASMASWADYSLQVNDSDCGVQIDSVAINSVTKEIAINTLGGAALTCVTYIDGSSSSSSSSSTSSSSSSTSSSSSSTSSSSSSTSSSAASVPGGVDLSGCGGVWPTGVVQGSVVDLTSPGSQLKQDLGRATLSIPFTTTNSATLFGQFAMAGTTGWTGTGREAWISTCPNTSFAQVVSNACKATGTESISLAFAQFSQRGSCRLQPNTQYFLNVRNTNCPSNANCSIYRITYIGSQ